MTEAELQALITDAASLGGWRVAHFRPARTTHGWRTPGSYDAQGFPDLVMCRGPDLIAWELKSDRGRPSPDQLAWLDAFAATGAETAVIRPADTDWCIDRLLRKPNKEPTP